MKYRILVVGGLLGAIGLGLGYFVGVRSARIGSGLLSPAATLAPRPYDAYRFATLSERPAHPSTIEIGRTLATYPEYTSYLFTYMSEGRRISGQLNLPNLSRTMAAIVMARGYVEKEQYTTGVGTKNAAAVYAKHGYITLAPDFSGYGESDPEDVNALGARLVKPVEVIDLIDSLPSLPQVDLSHVYLWGHSNGGQIMLSVAEVLGRREESRIPNTELRVKGLTLWAPVSKPFPYNILYYTDEADDQGKWLRHEVAQFESQYDVFDYSLDRYLDWITIPVQLHQGMADDAVPVAWSRALRDALKKQDKEIEYYEYPGADHNMRLQPTAAQSGGRAIWDTVVERDLAWFAKLSEAK